MYAHASVGVIHVQPLLDLRDEQDIENLKKITDETFDLVVKYGGSWSGEHGDGLVRSAYNERFFGKHLYQEFRNIKKMFDPENLMNPGKIVDAQTIEHNLRYGVSYKDRNSYRHFSLSERKQFQGICPHVYRAWESAERFSAEPCALVLRPLATKNIQPVAAQMH